jgi:hypothetical protein
MSRKEFKEITERGTSYRVDERKDEISRGRH